MAAARSNRPGSTRLSNGHPRGDGLHPGHLLDALDLANVSVLGLKYAQNVRKQFCKSVASAGAVTARVLSTVRRMCVYTLPSVSAVAQLVEVL